MIIKGNVILCIDKWSIGWVGKDMPMRDRLDRGYPCKDESLPSRMAVHGSSKGKQLDMDPSGGMVPQGTWLAAEKLCEKKFVSCHVMGARGTCSGPY